MGIDPEYLESAVAPRPAQAPPAPLSPPSFQRAKIIKEKIPYVSPAFRHLTRLESANHFLKYRKYASNYAPLKANNSFRINSSWCEFAHAQNRAYLEHV
jgi:hypothetical protein